MNADSKSRLVAISILVAMSAMPTVAGFPAGREAAGMAWNETTGRIVMFGGRALPDSSQIRWSIPETWEWTGARWVQRYPQSSPPARSAHAMVYNPAIGRVILFGGFDRDLIFDDMWAWDGTDWSRLEPGSRPSARFAMAATWDSTQNRMLMFGGRDSLDGALPNLRETWELSGLTWTRLGTSGPDLASPVIVHDPVRNQTLMLGAVPTTFATQMYRFNGTDWDPMTPQALPPCVSGATLTYQAHTNRILLAGGGCSNGLPTNETWQWTGENWEKLTLASNLEYTSFHSTAYDPRREELLTFGGRSFVDNVRTTYRLVGNAWVRVDDTTSPGPRSVFVLDSDREAGVSWLFGGHDRSDHATDLWKYSNGIWQEVRATPSPSGCLFPAGAFDPDRKRLVIVCDDSSVFEWNGQAWTTFANLTTAPPARQFSSVVYHPVLKKMVLYGGYINIAYSNETWTWDGAQWAQVAKDTRPPARSNAAMFWDPGQQKIFLYGGIGRPSSDDRIRRYGDMWSFDGTRWTELKNVAGIPSARYGSQVQFDPESNRVILFGGKNEQEEYTNEQFTWGGASWTKDNPSTPPSARMNGGLFYDPSTSRLTLYGGYAGYHFSEIWTFEGSHWSRVPDLGSRRRPAPREQSTPVPPANGVGIAVEQ